MFMRILWGKVKPGMWEAFERHYNERVIPTTRDMKGLERRRLLQGVDDPNEGMSVTVWKTMEDLENYLNNPKRQEMAKEVEHLYTGEFWVKTFRIKASS